MTTYRVLIVDDEQQVLDGLRRTLRHEGYEITTCTSPIDALEILDTARVDVLISDIDMPEMTGLELIQRTRREHPEVIRILLTGDASLSSAVTAINEGSVHKYLTKPWRATELREILRRTALELATLRQQAAAATVMEHIEQRREELEAAYPGISSVPKIDGSYLLNDMRVVERLAVMGEATAGLAATRWLPVEDNATEELGGKR